MRPCQIPCFSHLGSQVCAHHTHAHCTPPCLLSAMPSVTHTPSALPALRHASPLPLVHCPACTQPSLSHTPAHCHACTHVESRACAPSRTRALPCLLSAMRPITPRALPCLPSSSVSAIALSHRHACTHLGSHICVPSHTFGLPCLLSTMRSRPHSPNSRPALSHVLHRTPTHCCLHSPSVSGMRSITYFLSLRNMMGTPGICA